ncbi:Asp-tRNA(Asn)/Glu-tRNA(Gln) amidotransferase A subunit family amidase [Streptomyces sp. SAI-135]|uniref:amidase family protein n=1 Tax=unclassified Streptomyces TaxID=2593676 RepID=UPI002476EFB0|nr:MULTISPECIES: amidase family protein [unclassified Streptomyces]MDH6613315.1 Asp-tRNA(Asn)/Glu-tRNA(Gln) amidotransferase A subunit family amidase [Streptomyces sp. SAI-135]
MDPLAPLARSLQFAPATPFVNFAALPAIFLPRHVNTDGLPIGVQLAAAPGREDLLIRVAVQLEIAVPWQGRRPAL